MGKLKALIVALATALLCVALTATAGAAKQSFMFFYGQGCPHCAKVEAYFEQAGIYQKYQVDKREVYFNQDNAALFNKVMDEHSISATARGVPTVVIGNKVITGDETVISYFQDLSKNEQKPAASSTETAGAKRPGGGKLSIPLVVGASLVDAINPCAFAVLFILLATVLAKKNSRRRVLVSGLAFTAAIFISYSLMGLGVYKALGTLHTTSIITTIVGIGAVVLGVFNLKDWLWYGKFFKMEVPDGWRPKMKALISSVASPGAAFGIGVLVSLFLLPCTSGPYLVVLGLLAENTLNATAIGYLVLYNLIFILPMLVITFIVFEGSRVEKLQQLRERNLRNLHLIAGIILLALGVVILA